uniref:Xaa-Pro aminopeptidase P n=1 Tax=Chlamydomonas euryale TaxID=1486919 RepID=A0A7R9VKA2_9CHLO
MAPSSTAGPDERLASLRKAMAGADGGEGVHAFLIPTEDPHMSEYPPGCFARREWISRFTGTAGTAVVTTDKALLWTDGRYFLQAGKELGPEWTLMKAGTPGCPDIEDWLAEHLPDGGRVGIDPFVHTVDSARKLTSKLEAAGKSLVPLLADGNLVDAAWGSERPAMPMAPVRVHSDEWSGESVADKVKRTAADVTRVGADALLVTALDETAWLTNLRGGDVECNPVFVSYAIVRKDATASLYVDASKVSADARAALAAGGVELADYKAMVPDVAALAASGKRIVIDPSKVSFALYCAAKEAASAAAAGAAATEDACQPGSRKRRAPSHTALAPAAGPAPKLFVEAPSTVNAAKALKNAREMAGMREAHLRDAVAFVDFFCYMEGHLGSGGTLTEVEVDEQLTKRRAAQPGFIGAAFPTIAGAGANGAIIHYRPMPDSCLTVDGGTMLLLDSGGQYDCGTTDITRTMHYGQPTELQKTAYTRVLQGHIALDTATFPEGTPGCALDVLARAALWKEGLNYRHGTGHGVGAALNVHEGPQSISARFGNTTGLQARMVCSNEPGYYEDGSFGVRIENLVELAEVDTPYRFGGTPYLGFKAMTLVPISTKLIKRELLSDAEVSWLDAYHAQVWESVSPRLEGKPAEQLEWLRRNTRPLNEQLKA